MRNNNFLSPFEVDEDIMKDKILEGIEKLRRTYNKATMVTFFNLIHSTFFKQLSIFKF